MPTDITRGSHSVTKAVLLLLTAVSCLGISLCAATPGDVVINEVAWMGTQASSTAEWIELYNTTDIPIDLQGWSIFGADSGEILEFSAADGHSAWILSAHGYLLYANHATDITDQAGTGLVDIWDATIGMNNTSPGRLILYDDSGIVIDVANAVSGDWFAGETGPDYLTMERVDPLEAGDLADNWRSNDPGIARAGFDADGTPLNGTPKTRNSATNTDPTASAGKDQTVLVTTTVQLDGSGSFDPDGDPLTYAWVFTSRPAGSSAALSGAAAAQPTFTADAPGTYVATLSITDSYNGTATDEVAILAQAPPQAAFGSVPVPPTVWDTIRFASKSTDADGTITRWCWDFGDGGSSDAPNPKHRFRDAGRHVVVLEVTDNDGLTDAITRNLEILLGPGDLDGDGTLTILDVQVCHRIAVGSIEATSAQRAQGDIDGDGDVDLDDARALARFVIGM